MKNKYLIILASVLGFLVVGFSIVYFLVNEPLPEGKPGNDADTLARKMMDAVDVSAWEKTGAVQWEHSGKNQHLWDRNRHFSRVCWEKYNVLLDIEKKRGIAFEEEKRVMGSREEELVFEAWKRWANDSFWLNPVAKFFDPGTERKVVGLEDGTQALLLTYTSGGLTPGDSYLWFYGREGLPTQWKLWVSIIPIGGVSFTWEGWVTLATGAKIATFHKGPKEIVLTDVKGDSTLEALLPGTDPFAELEAMLAN